MSWQKLEKGLMEWVGIVLITIGLILMQSHFSWIGSFPKQLFVPFDSVLNLIMSLMIDYLGWFFRGISWLLEWPIKGVRLLLQSLPWAVTSFLFCLVAFIASGWRLACFAAASCLYICLLYTSPSPRDATLSRMPSSA